MTPVERFIREKPIHFDEAMNSSPREHLVEFWNWLDDGGYLSGLPKEAGAKVRLLVNAAYFAVMQMADSHPQFANYTEFQTARKALETALQPFQPLLRNRDATAKESDPGPDPGPSKGN